MAAITQRKLANACHVSQPVISEWLQAMHVSHRLDEEAAIMALIVAQLRAHGMPGPAAVKIVGQVRSYVRFTAIDPSHQTWLAVFDHEGAQQFTTSLTAVHLAAIMTSKPVCLTIALHELVARAAQRLQTMLAGKETS